MSSRLMNVDVAIGGNRWKSSRCTPHSFILIHHWSTINPSEIASRYARLNVRSSPRNVTLWRPLGRPGSMLGKDDGNGGFSWENHGKIMGKSWENHRKIMGKLWKRMKNPWDMKDFVGPSWEHPLWNYRHGLWMGNLIQFLGSTLGKTKVWKF